MPNNTSSVSIDQLLPSYNLSISKSAISLTDGRFITSVVIDGMPFESESDQVVQNAFLNVNQFLVSLGKDYGSKLAVWTHVVKKRVKLDEKYKFSNTFVQGFVDKYCEGFDKGNFFKTFYYITFVLKPGDVADGLEQIKAIQDQALVVLRRFNASSLGITSLPRGIHISDGAGFLAYLLNNNDVLTPLSHSPVIKTITDSDWYFGYDVMEIRNRESNKKKFAVTYLLKDYPAATEHGMWDFLLKLPYEFVLSQSFIFMSQAKSLKMIDEQMNKLRSVGDAAEQQLDELQLGKSVLASGEVIFGSLQSSLIVFGASAKEALDYGVKVTGEFMTEGLGTRWMKSNIEAPYTFASIMPGAKHRPLAAIHSGTNLSCGFSLHNYSFGKKSGNPIGDGTAIMPLKTRADGLYYFNTHYSDAHHNVKGQRIAGHAMFLGATGTGKTTLEGAACAFLQRFDPQMFVIDFNRSTELFVRAYGGSYFTLKEGEFTGLNPFQIEENPSNGLKQFCYQFVSRCGIDSEGKISDNDQVLVKKAVDAVLSMPCLMRRFGMILQAIPQGTDLRIRLAKWCASENGKFAWAVDSPRNLFNPKSFDKVGFDTTVILAKDQSGGIHPACEPILAMLFFFKTLMQQEGRLMLTIAEEFWMPCNFPLTQELIKGILKAGRLKGEFIWLVSQSPEDAIKCAIFEALVQQTPTKILLPNPDAKKDGYLQIGLTEKEFYELAKLDKESRTFLVKQSNSSSFVKMDLFGFDEYLPIISGTTKTIALCEQIRGELGTDDPEIWVPVMQQRLRDEKMRGA